jgi:hypothetical protein
VTALLDAAALAERMIATIERHGDLRGFFHATTADALRLLAKHARESGDALKALNDSNVDLVAALCRWHSVSDCTDLDELRARMAALDAWKRLAIRLQGSNRNRSGGAFDREREARDALRALGIDPATGERIKSPDAAPASHPSGGKA